MGDLRVVNAYWGSGVLTVRTRTEDGGSAERKLPAEHVGYLRRQDVSDQLARAIRVDGRVASMREDGDWYRVRFRDKWGAQRICEGFEERGIKTYEADVGPVMRYLVESGARIARPKRCYFDLELDSRCTIFEMLEGRARVLGWAIVGVDENNRVVDRVAGLLSADTNAAERDLMLDFWHELARYEQCVAWNGQEFDEVVLQERSRALKISVEMREWLWLDHLVIFRKMNVSASESGDEKQSMSLDSIAQAVLGRGKTEGADASKTYEMWRDDPALLMSYMCNDAALLPAIEDVTGYLDLHFAICEVCGILPDTWGAAPTKFVDGYMLRRALARGEHFETKFGVDDGERFPGAFVMEPTQTGILHDVHVCDFASLYPSIMITWNMSPDTYCPDVVLQPEPGPSYLRHTEQERRPIPDGCCASPDDAVFRTDRKGMIVEALEELLALRKEWSKKEASFPPGTRESQEAGRRSKAYKIAANSFYGVLGNQKSRYYVRAVAKAVTQTGAFLIKEVMREAELRGMKGIYGDTDSDFITGATVEEFREFTEWCNAELFPKIVERFHCATNRISLAYEKQFERLVLISKKRYAGRYAHYKGKAANEDSKPEVKGLEYKRGDSTKLARTFQAEVVDLLIGGGIISPRTESKGCDDPRAYRELVERWKDRILTAPLELKKFRISQTLKKEVAGYARGNKKDGSPKAMAPHAEVAKVLAARGHNVRPGMRVEYVVVDASQSPNKVIPAEDFDGTFDRHYLWESQVWPCVERVLEAAFPAARWEMYDRTRPDPRTVAAERAGQQRLF